MKKSICAACGIAHSPIFIVQGVRICRKCLVSLKDRIPKDGGPAVVRKVARDLYWQRHDGGPFYMKSMPKDLRKAAKRRAADEGLSFPALVIKALAEYVKP